MELSRLLFPLFRRNNLPSSKKKNKIKKKLWKTSYSSVKRNFLATRLGFFITVSSGVSISPLIFTIVFRVFSLLTTFVHFTNFRVFHHCFFRCFYFTTNSFHQFFLPCAIVTWVLWIWESFFTLRGFFTLTPFQDLVQPNFIKASLGANTSPLTVSGPPTENWNTDPADLFVWITQCSAKGIAW